MAQQQQEAKMDMDNIVTEVKKYINASRQDIVDFIHADWRESEHGDWLDTATDDEIAAWVIAGMR